MATCKLCERSGWLVALDENDLCDQCQRFHLRAIVSHRRLVSESLEIIESSRNPVSRLSRINVAIRNCLELEPYDRKGIRTITPAPRDVVRNLCETRTEIVKDEIRALVRSARNKAQGAPTISGKLEGYARAIDAISALMEELDDVTLAQRAITAIRAERDTLHFDHLFEKGEAAEAEGKTGQALKTYIDAMAMLSKDGAPGRHQADRIAKVRRRISDLGGDAPQ